MGRVREALFSILSDVQGARVLDLYAGTGALGIEALSRGAESSVFVEKDRRALLSLERNLTMLDLGEPRVKVMPSTVENALQRLDQGGSVFDLVLADPPYELWRATKLANLKSVANLLGRGGRFVLEAPRDASPPEGSRELEESHELEGACGLTRTAVRTYGDTALLFFGPADVTPS